MVGRELTKRALTQANVSGHIRRLLLAGQEEQQHHNRVYGRRRNDGCPINVLGPAAFSSFFRGKTKIKLTGSMIGARQPTSTWQTPNSTLTPVCNFFCASRFLSCDAGSQYGCCVLFTDSVFLYLQCLVQFHIVISHAQHAKRDRARCPATQNKFWEMHDYLYEHQHCWKSYGISWFFWWKYKSFVIP